MRKQQSPSGVRDCPEGGIGCRQESLPTGGSFITLTGGTLEQRRFSREYGKTAHASAPDDFPDVTENSLRRIGLMP